jgi:formate dehydrogenase N-like protein
VAMAAAVFGAIGHFMAYGPKKPKDTARESEGEV